MATIAFPTTGSPASADPPLAASACAAAARRGAPSPAQARSTCGRRNLSGAAPTARIDAKASHAAPHRRARTQAPISRAGRAREWLGDACPWLWGAPLSRWRCCGRVDGVWKAVQRVEKMARGGGGGDRDGGGGMVAMVFYGVGSAELSD
nr:unnamed protein product [Digitaria exilis]